MRSRIANCSLLLPTYNRANMFNCCLSSIAKQLVLPKEVIILDQGRLDGALINKNWQGILFPSKLIYKHISDRGKSRALNMGVKIATTDVIIVLDDDCYAHPKWIQSLIESIEKQEKTIITGQVKTGELEHGAVQVRDYVLNDSATTYKEGRFIIPIFVLSGGNLCFKKDDFYDIGEFNVLFGPGAEFRSAEDVEWSYRALSRGYKIYYNPQAIVSHRSWRSESQDIEIMANYGYGVGAFMLFVYQKNKLDFLYHGLNIIRWLFWEVTKSLIFFKNPQPHIAYLLGLTGGFRIASKQITI